MDTLKINFPMSGRYSNPAKRENEMNIEDIAGYFSDRLSAEKDSSIEHQLRGIANELRFEDRKGTIFELNKIWYKPWQFDQIMFVAAHIIDTNQYKKDCFHLLCEYEDSGKIYKDCFVAPQDRFLDAYGNNVNHCLVGTCIRKKQKVSAYTYNKYAHSGNMNTEEKKVTKLLNFYLL